MQAAARAAKSAELAVSLHVPNPTLLPSADTRLVTQARKEAAALAASTEEGSLVDELMRKLKEDATSPKVPRNRDRRRNQSSGAGTPRSGRPASPNDGESEARETTTTDISQNAALLLSQLRDEGVRTLLVSSCEI